MLTQSSDSLHTVKYRYGADGQRTNKYSVSGDKGESIYFNKLWTWRRDSFTPSAGNYCKNIFLDKTRIVTKVRAADETSSADAHREYFYHGDHLQSATLITDYEGAVYERINYTPYGELWLEKSDNNGENYLPYRFTGKELDSETGLYYYGARYLDPMYSRWLSTDPALGEYIPQAPVSDEAKKHNQNLPGMGGVFNTVNMNLYHYAGNNPVKYVDPDGNEIREITGERKTIVQNGTNNAIRNLSKIINDISNFDGTNNKLQASAGLFLGYDINKNRDRASLQQSLSMIKSDLEGMSVSDIKYDTETKGFRAAYINQFIKNGEIEYSKEIYITEAGFLGVEFFDKSMDGMLIHEESHKVLKTTDGGYGSRESNKLQNKQENADSWRLFYESYIYDKVQD